jgi:hypothetical protein
MPGATLDAQADRLGQCACPRRFALGASSSTTVDSAVDALRLRAIAPDLAPSMQRAMAQWPRCALSGEFSY